MRELGLLSPKFPDMLLATALVWVILDRGSSDRPATVTFTSCATLSRTCRQRSKQAAPEQASSAE